MATVSELLIRARLEDQVSQASRDAAKALREVGDGADAAVQGVERVSAAVRRSGQAQSEYARGLQQAQQADANAAQATEGRIRALERLRAAQAAAASGPQGDASWLSTIEEGAAAASAGLSKLGIDLGPVTEGFNKAKAAATALYTVFTGGAGLIPAIGAVATAASAAYAIYSNWETITGTLSRAMDVLTGRIRDQVNPIKQADDAIKAYMQSMETAGERSRRLFAQEQAQHRASLEALIAVDEAKLEAVRRQMGAGQLAGTVNGALQGLRDRNPAVGSPDWYALQNLERVQGAVNAEASIEGQRFSAQIDGLTQSIARLRETLANMPTLSGGGDEYGPPGPDRGRSGGSGGRGGGSSEIWRDPETGYSQAVSSRLQGFLGNAQQIVDRADQRRAQEMAREAERAQREIDRTVERFGDGIADALVDGLTEGGERGKPFIDRIGDFFKKAMARSVAESLSSSVIQPVLRAVMGGGVAVMTGGAGYGPGYGPGISGDAAVYNGAGVSGYALPAAAQGGAGYGSWLDLAGRGSSLFGGNLFSGSGSSGIGRWVSDVWNRPVSTIWGGGAAATNFAGGTAADFFAGGVGGDGLSAGIDAGYSAYAAQQAGGLTIGQAAMGAGGIALGGYGIYTGLQQGGARGYANATAGAAGVVGGAATIAGGLGVAGLAGIAAVAPYVAAIAAIVAMALPEKSVNPGAAAQIQVDGEGRLYVGKVGGKHVDVGAFEANVNQQLTDIQKLLNAGDIRVSGLNYADNRNWVGTGPAANMLNSSVQDVIWGGRQYLTSDNPAIEQVLRSNKVTSFEQMLGGATWVQQVYDPLMKYGEAVSSYAERVKQLTDTFEDAIQGARDLGIAEADLVKKRGEALADLQQQRAIDIAVMEGGLDARRQTVGGKTLLAQLTRYDLDTAGQRRALEDQLAELDLDPATMARRLSQFDRITTEERTTLIESARRPLEDQSVADRVALLRLRGRDEQAALVEFDYAAGRRREGLLDAIRGASTDVNAVGQPAARRMILQLEERLAEERLAIIAQFNRDAISFDKAGAAAREAASGTATNVVTQLADYARGLAVSDRSPLSPREQFVTARNAFNAVAERARRGDIAGAAQLPGVADSLLGAAREIYGSGAGYAQVYERVQSVLEKFAEQSADTLTRSAYENETRNQTVKLEEALERLRAEVRALRQDQQQLRAAPARAAA